MSHTQAVTESVSREQVLHNQGWDMVLLYVTLALLGLISMLFSFALKILRGINGQAGLHAREGRCD